MEFDFTEYDGMVVFEPLTEVAESIRHLRETGKFHSRWQYERGSNHVHADVSQPHRIRVREECDYAARLEAALRWAYPDLTFAMSHIPAYGVSFYQRSSDAPTEDILPTEPAGETVWCQTCQRGRPYERSSDAGTEFPRIEWGRCAICGDDVIVRAGELLKGVGPEIA